MCITEEEVKNSLDKLIQTYGAKQVTETIYNILVTVIEDECSSDGDQLEIAETWVKEKNNFATMNTAAKENGREYALTRVKALEIGKVHIEVGELIDEQHKDGGPLWYNIFLNGGIVMSGGTILQTPEEILEDYISNGGDVTG